MRDVESPILEPAQQGPALPPAPEPGQVVTVRGSTWAVTDVQEQVPHRRPSGADRTGHTHVVRLQSLAEERLGQELTVVWELEVGHSLVPAQGLPEAIRTQGFDDPNALAAIIDAVRWGAVTSADPEAYQAPFRSGANVEAYQLEPLRRALDASRANLLLADDVGLGKTIEAGLVVQELLLRHRARSVIIVCPPSLRIKWQDEMRDKFGLHFEIVDSELMAGVRRTHGLAANPFRLFPRTIVSMAWLSSVRAQRLLREVYGGDSDTARRYAFDVLVVDEAHHVAPASPTAVGGARGYAVDSKRTIAVRNLADQCEHRLFLSATPHNGYSESFTALMEMIDGRRFTRGARLDEHALREVAVRCLKTDLKNKDFKARQLDTIDFEPSAEEQEHFAQLERLLAESAKRSGKRGSADIVAMLLKKRFLSSPWSFALTMERYEESDAGRALDIDDEQTYYAETLGSGQSDEEEGMVVWERDESDSDQVLVPAEGDDRSVQRLLRRAVTDLAVAEERPLDEALSDLEAPDADTQRFQLFPPAPSGMIPFTDGRKAIDAIYHLLRDSGRNLDEGHKLLYQDRASESVYRFLDRVRLGLTAPGSYIFTTKTSGNADTGDGRQSALFDLDNQADHAVLSDHDIILRLHRAVNRAHAVSKALLERREIGDLTEVGLSANFYKAVAELGGSNHDREFEIGFQWGFGHRASLPKSVVRFTDRMTARIYDFGVRLEELAKTGSAMIDGKVMSLATEDTGHRRRVRIKGLVNAGQEQYEGMI